MSKNVDITGQRFGQLVALRFDHNTQYKNGSSIQHWLFQCDCGKQKVMIKRNVIAQKVYKCHRGENIRKHQREREKYQNLFGHLIGKGILTERQEEIAKSLIETGSQLETAKKLNIYQSTISKTVFGTFDINYDKNYGGIVKKAEMVKNIGEHKMTDSSDRINELTKRIEQLERQSTKTIHAVGTVSDQTEAVRLTLKIPGVFASFEETQDLYASLIELADILHYLDTEGMYSGAKQVLDNVVAKMRALGENK